ncbi:MULTISPECIES: DUF2680 domain-containing protein [Desulfitobacterium]|uniref:DUF2680 domain-containing protein n=1 Tax=Desulfitobacterium dehalogenans (strain ATCC 51507 / DSM 9161 / JW/IU-DC1) TaxID=756499 RepID=I4AEE4_DESDJ|nr:MULTISPECIES: DUF2680 domain-containing protein [Desulfitobacterium]AFM02329.1 Protein of unknown function (DUF2680) [Desulfitobacterium dehalogenans ATCC 51507]
MLKKLAVSLLTLAFLTFGAGTAFGATTTAPDPAKLAEIKALHQQMVELKVQMIDKKVEAGILEKEKAEKIKEAIKERQKKVEEDLANGKVDFGKKHHKDCDKKPKGDSKETPDAKSSSSIRLTLPR